MALLIFVVVIGVFDKTDDARIPMDASVERSVAKKVSGRPGCIDDEEVASWWP